MDPRASDAAARWGAKRRRGLVAPPSRSLAASCVVEMSRPHPSPMRRPHRRPRPSSARPRFGAHRGHVQSGRRGRLVRGGDVLTDSGIPVIAGRAAAASLVAPSDDWDRREVAELELGAPEDWRDLGDDLDVGDDDDSAPADEDPVDGPQRSRDTRTLATSAVPSISIFLPRWCSRTSNTPSRCKPSTVWMSKEWMKASHAA